MKSKNTNLTIVDDSFSKDEKRADDLHEKVELIPLVELYPFSNHPFKVKDDEAMAEELSKRAAEVHTGRIDPKIDNMLKITSDGRKLGLDQRIVNPLLPDDENSKVNTCVNNVFRIWEDGADERLTQLLFCDISTPKSKVSKQELYVAKTSTHKINGVNIKAIEDMLPEDVTAKETPFSIYDDIKSKLITRGVPSEQIAFIHDANTEVKKKELYAKVRTGDIRILLGSTAKCGSGMNVQDRLVALHDLDCPWRPGEDERAKW